MPCDRTATDASLNGLLTVDIHGKRNPNSFVNWTRYFLERATEAIMKFADALRRMRYLAAVVGAAAAVVGLGTLVGLALPQYSVSQKGREFNPGQITIKRGETVQIVNDDGDLLHHAYVDSEKFTFDSGDQQPGSKTDITFPVAGKFDVLCAIHPKMKLEVSVR
jgi:plastocyanin